MNSIEGRPPRPAPAKPGGPSDHIVESDGVALLRPSMAGRFPGLTIALSTRKGGVSAGDFGLNTSFRVGDDAALVEINRLRFFEAAGMPPGAVVTAGQVHGVTVKRVERPGHYPDCDGFVTDRRGLFLAVTIADCLAVFFHDAVRRAIGVVHAGWRGTSGGIVAECAALMAADYSSRPEDLFVYIGPGAGACCYEVGEDVAGSFPEEHLREHGPGKYLLDLPSFNRNLLVRAGVPKGQITVSSHCTIHEKDLFHSFRRDAARSGRMLGVIGLVD